MVKKICYGDSGYTVTCYAVMIVQFQLLPSTPLPPGFVSFFFAVYSPPPGMQKEIIPCRFGSNNNVTKFCTIPKADILLRT